MSKSAAHLLDLESSNPGKKLLLFMHELQQLQQKLNSLNGPGSGPATVRFNQLTKPLNSELFDHDIYLDVMSDMACFSCCQMRTFGRFQSSFHAHLLGFHTGTIESTRFK
jgi:hypothetical protein